MDFVKVFPRTTLAYSLLVCMTRWKSDPILWDHLSGGVVVFSLATLLCFVLNQFHAHSPLTYKRQDRAVLRLP